MRLALALASALVAPAAATAATAAPSVLARADLPAGRYTTTVEGMLCAVCARAIAAQWAKLPEVESASVDYQSGRAVIVVRLGRTLRLSALLESLRRAERLANLGARYRIGEITYLP